MGNHNTERKKLQRLRKKERESMNIYTTPGPPAIPNFLFDIVNIPMTCAAPPKRTKAQTISHEGEDNMMTDLQRTQLHLVDRARSEYYGKEETIGKQYGLRDDDEPSTAKELVERIKDGKYVLTHDADKRMYGGIKWRDPDVKEDREGWKTAREEARKAFKATEDKIMVYTDGEKALAAYNEFEAMDFGPGKKKSKH